MKLNLDLFMTIIHYLVMIGAIAGGVAPFVAAHGLTMGLLTDPSFLITVATAAKGTDHLIDNIKTPA